MTMDHPALPFDTVFPLLEQAEAVVRAWTSAIADPAPARGPACHPSASLRAWVTGGTPAQSSELVGHLEDCASCRREVRDWRILHRGARTSELLDLEEVRAICQRRPESSTAMLGQVAVRISNMLSPVVGGDAWPERIDVPLTNARHEYVGENARCAFGRPPRIDSTSTLRLDLLWASAPAAGYDLSVRLRDDLGAINIGRSSLFVGMATIDLSDLVLHPGYFVAGAVELTALVRTGERSRLQSSVLDTAPLPAAARSREGGSGVDVRRLVDRGEGA
jgi:hypothetical protein